MSRLFALLALFVFSSVSFAQCADWQDHSLGKLHSSQTLDLCEVMGARPVLIVNTASHCGYTRQFKGLEALHQRYAPQGLVVVGFPSNSFRQEAGSEAEIADVCYKNYGVTFTMTEEIEVKGENAHPVFKAIAQTKGAPKWNFNKFLVDRNGKIISQFGSSTEPDSTTLNDAIQKLL